jgi:hypothetical protein
MSKLVQPNDRAEEKSVVFWAPAKGYQIANFRPEKKNEHGGIETSEKSLRFSNHIFATADAEIIAFVTNSAAFRDGHVKKCADANEAKRLTDQHERMRGVRTLNSESVESSVITDLSGSGVTG